MGSMELASARDRFSGQPPTHAGGVVVRQGPGGLRYLLVRARRDPGLWIFPKGHVEPGEKAEDAAVREVREEAGVQARVLEPLDLLVLPDSRIALFLMRYEADVAGGEGRETAWCDLDEAQGRLAFPESREVLVRAHARLGTAG